MITVKVLENRLRFLGIFDIRSPTSLTHSLINISYRAFVLSILLFLFIFSGWFMLFEARTYDEFTQIASVMAGAVVGLAIHISFLCDKSNIILIMNDLNELVGRSKWKLSGDWNYSIIIYCCNHFVKMQELKVVWFMKKQSEKLKSRWKYLQWSM